MAMSKFRQVDMVPDQLLSHCDWAILAALPMNLLSQPTFPPLREEQAERLQEAFRELRMMANQPSPGVAFKVKRRIRYINLGKSAFSSGFLPKARRLHNES